MSDAINTRHHGNCPVISLEVKFDICRVAAKIIEMYKPKETK